MLSVVSAFHHVPLFMDISWLLLVPVATGEVMLNVRCWSWARMCCLWKLPNLS